MMRYAVPQLETDRLILRTHIESDIDAEIAFYQTDAAQFVGGRKSAEDTWRYISMMMGHWALRGYGYWALEDKDTGVYHGRVGLWFPRNWLEREIAWTLMPSAQGKGYATEAAEAARAYAYDVLGWDTAISQIDPANHASKAVARRLGATYEKDHTTDKYGVVEVWRHLSPADLVNGGMEAYA